MSIIIAIICVLGVCAGIGYAVYIAKENFYVKEAAREARIYGRSDGENTEVKQSKKVLSALLLPQSV